MLASFGIFVYLCKNLTYCNMRSFKRFLSLVSCLLTAFPVLAGEINESDALKKAEAFMPGRHFITQKYAAARSDKQVCNAFYIFNVEHNGGYVIVSGDDRTVEILGYSTQGNIDLNKIPENVKKWLDGYASQLAAIEDGRLIPSKKAGTRAAKSNIEPLMSSTWDQNEPYNLMCPDGKGKDYNESGYDVENRCVTGCVATAIAQMMYYYKKPLSTPAIPSYTPSHLNKQLAELPATKFKWDKMKDSYGYNETGESADAVAELMRYVGQAIGMNYDLGSNGGSAASLNPTAMINYFGYSKNMRTIYRDDYTSTQWENIIYDELQNNRPVPYSGQSEVGGHQFICDGYKDGLFYLNWGWGGFCDGYFVLSVADPGSDQGIGGGNGAYQYHQDATINFAPSKKTEEEIPIISGYVDKSFLTKGYSRKSTSADFKEVALAGSYCPYYYYKPSSVYPIEIGWGLYLNDELIQSVGYSKQTIDNTALDPGWYSSYNNNLSVSFGSGLSDGKYQLRQIFRKQGASDWTLCEGYGVNYLVAEISGTSLKVRVAESESESFTVNSVTVSDKPILGKKVDVTVNVTNEGETNQEQVLIWLKKKGASEWRNVASVKGTVGPGETGDVIVSFIPDDSGNFTLKVTNSSSEDALATATFSIAKIVSVTIEGVNYSAIPDFAEATIVGTDESFSTEILTLPSTIQAEGVDCKVVSIEDGAFWYSYHLLNLTIPEGVERIGNNAFNYCYSLAKIVLPSTLKSIGENAFANCNLTAVQSYITKPFEIPENTFQVYDYEADKVIDSPATLYVPIGSKSKYVATPGWTQFAKIEEGELKEATVDGLNYSYSTGSMTATVLKGDYSELKSVTIPNSIIVDGEKYKVIAIGDNAFESCYSLKSITINADLESIGKYAFLNVGVSGIKLPQTLKSIGEYAFAYCYNISSIILPPSLTSIGEYAFGGCDNLERVISNVTNPIALDENAFMSREYVDDAWTYFEPSATLYVPSGAKSKYVKLSGWSKFANIVEVPSSVSVKIGGNGFSTYTSSHNLDFSGTEEVKAYVATGYDYDTKTIWLTRVKDVPAGTALLLKGTANKAYEIPANIYSSSYFVNMFKGNNTAASISISETENEMTNYYLKDGEFKYVNGSANIGAGKSYLQIPTYPPYSTMGDKQKLTMNAYGFASYCGGQDLDFTNVKGLKAFAATGYDDASGVIWLTRVMRVSAYTPLLLIGGASGSYDVPSTSVSSYYANMLKGNSGDATIEIEPVVWEWAPGGYEYMTNYYLKKNQLLKVSGTANIVPGKAYMQIPSKHVTRAEEDEVPGAPYYNIGGELEVISMKVGTRGIEGDGEDTTGISEVMVTDQEPDVYYNLQGQRVENPGKGIYIMNGKKVVIR